MVDHVYSFSRIQERPLELFQNLHERGFLDAFLEHVKVLDPATHADWTKTPIPLTDEEAQLEIRNIEYQGRRVHSRKKGHEHKKGHDRQEHKKGHHWQ